jgi:hypothetical protein
VGQVHKIPGGVAPAECPRTIRVGKTVLALPLILCGGCGEEFCADEDQDLGGAILPGGPGFGQQREGGGGATDASPPGAAPSPGPAAVLPSPGPPLRVPAAGRVITHTGWRTWR